MRARVLPLIAMVAHMLAGAAAYGQTPPAGTGDPLKDICTGFLAQSGAGVAGDQAKLCTCLVAETQKQLSRQEMEIYDKAASTGAPPPPAIMQKVMGIAALCLTRR